MPGRLRTASSPSSTWIARGVVRRSPARAVALLVARARCDGDGVLSSVTRHLFVTRAVCSSGHVTALT